MSATTTTSRLDLVASIYRSIRCEKDPPLARYAIVLAIARRGGSPATGSQIGKDIGMESTPNGSIDSCLRHGLISTSKDGPSARTYTLTPKGIDLVRTLTHPTIHPPS